MCNWARRVCWHRLGMRSEISVRRAVLGVLVALGPVMVVVYCMVLPFGWRCEDYWRRTLCGEWVQTGFRMLSEAVSTSEVGGVSLYADENI